MDDFHVLDAAEARHLKIEKAAGRNLSTKLDGIQASRLQNARPTEVYECSERRYLP
jgi:hypothetical protein